MHTVEAAPAAVPSAVVEDLRTRLHAVRTVALPPSDAWSLGVEPTYFANLLRYWRDEYDWRGVEARIRALPWVVAGAQDAPVRIVHQTAADERAPVVVLLHGWPDSVLRFEKVLPRLRDVHVVSPALPGFPFAAATPRTIESADDMAAAIADALADLGYDRYVVSAGDVGTDVAESLAARQPDRVAALHLTDLSHRHALADQPDDLTPEETTFRSAVQQWHAAEGGYNHQQSTRPNTLAIGLGDSPAGLAAWIVEKLYVWSDNRGNLESVFSLNDALDWVSAYWMTGAIGTSFSPYAHRAAPGKVVAPTVFTMFPADLVNAPRSFTERIFDVRSYTVADGGGHFDAWERPDEYVAGIRNAISVQHHRG